MFWSVWHEGRDFEHYRDVQPRFCSNLVSVLSVDAGDPQIRRCCRFQYRGAGHGKPSKNKGGNARIAETMFRYFRFPVGFENFVYVPGAAGIGHPHGCHLLAQPEASLHGIVDLAVE